jgi:hypothetical protein
MPARIACAGCFSVGDKPRPYKGNKHNPVCNVKISMSSGMEMTRPGDVEDKKKAPIPFDYTLMPGVFMKAYLIYSEVYDSYTLSLSKPGTDVCTQISGAHFHYTRLRIWAVMILFISTMVKPVAN